LLIKFRDNYAHFDADFTEAQNSDDPQAASRCAHSLKGVAGNIGAIDIQRATAALELACNDTDNKDAIIEQLDIVKRNVQSVLISLKHLEENEAQSKNQETDNARFFIKLRICLEDNDAQALDLIKELPDNAFNAAHKEVLKDLTTAVDEFDFDEAIVLLTKLEK
jgi:two-component system sensor histidine kinase/response regulator